MPRESDRSARPYLSPLTKSNEGDVIIKGANALDASRGQTAILIGDPQGGTIVHALHAVLGRRIRLLLPVGLEKRVHGDLHELAGVLNLPGVQGPRLLPVPGEVVTEIEALKMLTGAQAHLVAAGGVCGAEGAVWLAVTGSAEELRETEKIMAAVSEEPPFSL